MTKKHYILLASDLSLAYKELRTEDACRGFEKAVRALLPLLQKNNPLFQKETFLNAIYQEKTYG